MAVLPADTQLLRTPEFEHKSRESESFNIHDEKSTNVTIN